jgi:hypothetical protein
MKTKKIKLEITCDEADLLLRLVKQHKEKTCPIRVDFKELTAYAGTDAYWIEQWIEEVTCEQRGLCERLENKLMR